jgi:hypothetical protein
MLLENPWLGEKVGGADVVLRVKHYIASTAECQQPLVVLPVDFLSRLPHDTALGRA